MGKYSDIGLKTLRYEPQSTGNKNKNDKWDYIKPKIFCITKEIINILKGNSTELENVFATHAFDKGFIFKIIKKHNH